MELIKKNVEKDLIVVLKKQDTDPRKYAKLIGDNFKIANYNQWIWDRYGNRVERPTEVPDYDNWDNPDTYPIQRVTGMKKENNRYAQGKILDPKKGKLYSCTMWMKNKDTLKVRGWLGPFYRTQTWYRVD